MMAIIEIIQRQIPKFFTLYDVFRKRLRPTLVVRSVRLLRRLHGMAMGVSHGSSRAIVAARVVMDFLGTEIDIQAALDALGTFDADHPSVPELIRRGVVNEIMPDEVLFLARP